jgi:LmbE family N-acetylglucosaminyl deacetylase
VAAPERELDGAAKAAAEAMGARIISARSAVGEEDSAQRVADLLQRIVRELRPATIYVPAPEDGHRGRRRIFEMARPTLSGVPRVLAYATATTDVAFRPVRFEDVEAAMSDKLEVLSHYRESGRRELSGRFARAAARYWGRFAEFGEVEPFAEVKVDGTDTGSEEEGS